jgi:hypothetical protein
MIAITAKLDRRAGERLYAKRRDPIFRGCNGRAVGPLFAENASGDRMVAVQQFGIQLWKHCSIPALGGCYAGVTQFAYNGSRLRSGE